MKDDTKKMESLARLVKDHVSSEDIVG